MKTTCVTRYYLFEGVAKSQAAYITVDSIKAEQNSGFSFQFSGKRKKLIQPKPKEIKHLCALSIQPYLRTTYCNPLVSQSSF